MFYNLYPEDAPNPVPLIVLRYSNDKWVEVRANSTRSASGLYNFVSVGGMIYISKASRSFHGSPIGHIDLARAGLVDYAGEIRFAGRKKRGLLRFWNNLSGHYQPSADQASRAGLPMELFQPGFSW